MVPEILCSLTSHKVDRHRVWHDSLNFRTKCARCGEALLRTRNGWRVYDPTSDRFEKRLHPATPPAQLTLL